MICKHESLSLNWIRALALLAAVATTSYAKADTMSVRVRSASDDQEEKLTNRRFAVGHLGQRSSDLELGSESDDVIASMPQAVGLRFRDVDLAPRSTINHAAIQFTVDEPGSLDTSLLIYGELRPNPRTFSSGSFNITNRPRTEASVEWNAIPAWETAGDAGSAQQTPDLSAIVQELVNQPEWDAGNPMAFILTVTPENYGGQRTAVAFDGNPASAPELIIDFAQVTELLGDLDGDGSVDFEDFAILSSEFGVVVDPPGSRSDLDKDGIVAFTDFLILSDNFGRATPTASVPEPSTTCLLVVVAMLGGLAIRYSRRSTGASLDRGCRVCR